MRPMTNFLPFNFVFGTLTLAGCIRESRVDLPTNDRLLPTQLHDPVEGPKFGGCCGETSGLK